MVYNNFTIIITTQPSLSAPPLPPPQPKEVSVRKGSLFQLRRSDSGVQRKVRNRTLNHILRCPHNLNSWDRRERQGNGTSAIISTFVLDEESRVKYILYVRNMQRDDQFADRRKFVVSGQC